MTRILMALAPLAFAVLSAIATIAPMQASAKEFKIGDITIENPWARSTFAAAKTGAAFLTIRNAGTAPDRLLSVRSDVSRRASLHQSLMQDGIMKMRPAGALVVPAGGKAMLKPGGYHIMFMGLKAPFKEGGSFPLTLVFERAGTIKVTVDIMQAGAMGGMKMKPAN